MTLALYDEELRNYDYQDLVKAFNEAVQIAPESIDNPSVLRNLMIRNIQSSGVKDVAELTNELKLGDTLKSRREADSKSYQEAKERAKVEKASPKSRVEVSAMFADIPQLAGSVVNRFGERVHKSLSTLAKPEKGKDKGKDKPDKPKPSNNAQGAGPVAVGGGTAPMPAAGSPVPGGGGAAGPSTTAPSVPPVPSGGGGGGGPTTTPPGTTPGGGGGGGGTPRRSPIPTPTTAPVRQRGQRLPDVPDPRAAGGTPTDRGGWLLPDNTYVDAKGRHWPHRETPGEYTFYTGA
jgi:hypothetical protein